MPTRRPPSHRFARRALAVCVLVLSAGWAGCRNDTCSTEMHNASLFQLMEYYYFFNGEPDQVAKYQGVDPASFAGPEAVLDYLRYQPDLYDRGFTYITTPQVEEQFRNAGLLVAFGIGLLSPAEGELFVSYVEPLSPAWRAGLARGDQLIEIDGVTVAALEASGATRSALGPSVEGYQVTFLVEKGDSSGQQEITLAKETIVSDVVPDVWDVFDVDGEDVGYLLFHSFIPPAISELRAAFQSFADAGVTKVVIDLRYNGGGHLAIAESIINVLGGDGNVGEVQYTARFSSSEPAQSEDVEFAADEDAFPVDTIVFITTARSASASELLINALEPHRTVLVVGDTSGGKPVGQGAIDYCFGEYRLRVVAFDLVNSEGEGEYYAGIDADCPAIDDLGNALGDPAEASMATALTAAATGACPPATARAATAPRAPTVPAWLGPTPVPWLDVY